ncbi:MAG: saccharopine dehydrogenase NADP-binding domain-containing protein [Myxococcaceae bacterium]
MSEQRWLLYGAYGYTGELLAEEAVRRGHRPTLAGRSAAKLEPLARRLGLPSVVVDLEDRGGLRKALEGHALALHAAGPFVHTAAPMLWACLDAGAHYLDITGEIPVFEQTFAHDKQARERNVALISGVGFDVVPTDCMARYVSERVKDARALHLAFDAVGSPSAGTTLSALEGLPQGGRVRRGGMLVPWPLGKGARTVRFPGSSVRTVVPIPWGDLVTAFHTTGIPDITTYMSMPPRKAAVLRVAGPGLQLALRSRGVRHAAAALVRRTVKGPNAAQREAGRSRVWARAENDRGEFAEAWLETLEGYDFTARSGIRAVEKTLELRPRGATTPARAFGADFVLEIEGTRRFDALQA